MIFSLNCNHAYWSAKPTCYFCNKKPKWKNVTLADGCVVPACGECFADIEKSCKIAESRGLYTPKRDYT